MSSEDSRRTQDERFTNWCCCDLLNKWTLLLTIALTEKSSTDVCRNGSILRRNDLLTSYEEDENALFADQLSESRTICLLRTGILYSETGATRYIILL